MDFLVKNWFNIFCQLLGKQKGKYLDILINVFISLYFDFRFTVKHDTGEFIEEDCHVKIDYFKTDDERKEAMRLMNSEIESGKSLIKSQISKVF